MAGRLILNHCTGTICKNHLPGWRRTILGIRYGPSSRGPLSRFTSSRRCPGLACLLVGEVTLLGLERLTLFLEPFAIHVEPMLLLLIPGLSFSLLPIFFPLSVLLHRLLTLEFGTLFRCSSLLHRLLTLGFGAL